MMKSRLILAALAAAVSLPMAAQHFSVGPEVGYEYAGFHVGGNQHELTAHNSNGLRIGASAAYQFGNGLFLQSGLSYSHREGGRLKGVDDSRRFPYVKDIKLRSMDFLTLPLTVGYEFSLPSKWGIGVEAGGYVASGIGMGSTYFSCTDGEGSGGSLFKDSEFTMANADGSDRLKVNVKASDRVDAGCTFGAHVRFDRIRLRATYQLGLHRTVYDVATPRTLTLSLAYLFNL